MGGKALGGNKITNEEAWYLFNRIIATHKLETKHNRILLCGSARRGKKKCGDLDIVFQDNVNDDGIDNDCVNDDDCVNDATVVADIDDERVSDELEHYHLLVLGDLSPGGHGGAAPHEVLDLIHLYLGVWVAGEGGIRTWTRYI